jgi:hypothetical protein
MRVTIISRKSFKAHLDMKFGTNWVYSFINYQKSVNRSSTPHTPLNRLRLPWNCFLLFASILCHQAASSNESTREHTAAFSSINYFRLFFFVLVSSFSGLSF